MTMSPLVSTPDRRRFLIGFSAAVGALSLGLLGASRGLTEPAAEADQSVVSQAPPQSGEAGASESIRSFVINVPEDALVDLRRRITATRWPDRETVADRSQGAQLTKIQELVSYWGTGYDWRRVEATLNSWPNFMTTIDGLDIHFMHIRSPHPDAVPLIMTHGWPDSVLELVKVIGPLTDPTAHGGRAEDAFHLV